MLLYLVFEKRLNIRETVNYQAQDDTAPIPPILLLRGRFLNARPAASRPSDQVLNHQWLTQISCVIESLIQAVTVFLEEEECQEGLPKCYPLNRPQVAAVLPINLTISISRCVVFESHELSSDSTLRWRKAHDSTKSDTNYSGIVWNGPQCIKTVSEG